MGQLKLVTLGIDGTKIHGNASRHSALSYEHAGKIEAQLKAEVAELMAKADAADKADIPDGMSIPDELARREDRLQKIAEARTKIEARGKERFAREQAEHEAKLAAREAKTAATGKKPSGKPPRPPTQGPLLTDQINLTDEESRIMPVAGGGFEQCYNAQAAVAEGSLSGGCHRCCSSLERQAAARTDARQDRRLAGRTGRGRNAAGRYRLFQRRECGGLRSGSDRAADRHGPTAASSTSGRALRRSTARAEKPNAGPGHGASAANARRQQALFPAETDPGTAARHHQSGRGLPP